MIEKERRGDRAKAQDSDGSTADMPSGFVQLVSDLGALVLPCAKRSLSCSEHPRITKMGEIFKVIV